jgi:hypothetical protein
VILPPEQVPEQVPEQALEQVLEQVQVQVQVQMPRVKPEQKLELEPKQAVPRRQSRPFLSEARADMRQPKFA